MHNTSRSSANRTQSLFIRSEIGQLVFERLRGYRPIVADLSQGTQKVGNINNSGLSRKCPPVVNLLFTWYSVRCIVDMYIDHILFVKLSYPLNSSSRGIPMPTIQ